MNKLRIGITLPHLKTGGIERGIVNVLAPLNAAGFTTTLFLQDKTGDLLSQVPKGTTVVALNGAGVWAGSAALATALKHAPVDILWSATNASNVLNLIAAKRLRGARPKVVIGEHIPLDHFIATRKFPAMRRAIMQVLYPRAAAVTAPLQPILDEHQRLLGRRCPPCTVLPNPVIDRLALGAPIAETATRFVTLGRLSAEKDYDLAIRTFASLSDRLPDATLTLYGEGAEHAHLDQLIGTLNLANRVTLAGAAPNAAAALEGADMLWCTSKMEGFGNVLVEAQSMGVPVASVDCPFGPRTILQGGEAGCLMEGRNPQDLARRIEAFARDPHARRAAQSAGYAVAQTNTITASVTAHVAFFNMLARD